MLVVHFSLLSWFLLNDDRCLYATPYDVPFFPLLSLLPAVRFFQIQNAEKIASGEKKPPDYFAPEEEFPMEGEDEFEDVTVSRWR